MAGILVSTTGLCPGPAMGLAVGRHGLDTGGHFFAHAGLGETAAEGCLLIRYSKHVSRTGMGRSSYLDDSQGNDESIWALPDGLSCFSLIIIWYATARLVTKLPPLAILAGREAV